MNDRRSPWVQTLLRTQTQNKKNCFFLVLDCYQGIAATFFFLHRILKERAVKSVSELVGQSIIHDTTCQNYMSYDMVKTMPCGTC